jgi:malate synthase
VALLKRILREELNAIRTSIGEEAFESGRFDLAADIFEDLVTSPELEDFLTLVAYLHL